MNEHIEIVGWKKFQHSDATKHGNAPIWIKNYTKLLSKDEYLELNGHQRAVLHGLWLEYARSGQELAVSTASLSRRLNLKVTKAQLRILETHGFIEIRQDEITTAARLDQKRGEQELQQPSTTDLEVVQEAGSSDPMTAGAVGPAWGAGNVVELDERRPRGEVNGRPIGAVVEETLAALQAARGTNG